MSELEKLIYAHCPREEKLAKICDKLVTALEEQIAIKEDTTHFRMYSFGLEKVIEIAKKALAMAEQIAGE